MDFDDSKRLEWLRDRLFCHSWNGVVGAGSRVCWRIAGDFRHTQQRLVDASGAAEGDFRAAIDAAMKDEQ